MRFHTEYTIKVNCIHHTVQKDSNEMSIKLLATIYTTHKYFEIADSNTVWRMNEGPRFSMLHFLATGKKNPSDKSY
jgi:hypothetical protein